MTECSCTDTLENDTVFFDFSLTLFEDSETDVEELMSSASASKGEIFSQPNVVGFEERETANRLTMLGRSSSTTLGRKLLDGVLVMSGVNEDS